MDDKLKQDVEVTEITIGNGFLNIDLSSGLRLSGPLMSAEEMVRATSRLRSMSVNHDSMSSQAPAYR